MFKRTLNLFIISSILLISCKSGGNEPPNMEALLTEFSIEEVSGADFQIDNENGLVTITNIESIVIPDDKSNLTASFEISGGASVLVGNQIQVSGESKNSFSEGLLYTIVSEDESVENEYFIHLEESLPVQYFGIDSLELDYNPNGISPLSAKISGRSRVAASVNMEIQGSIPISQSFEETVDHNIEIHGLYAGTDNEIEITFESENGLTASKTYQVATDPLPSFFPDIEMNVVNESQMEPGMHFSEMHLGNMGTFNSYPLIFDNNGDVRWYVDFSDRGDIIWPIQFNDDMSFYSSSGVTIHEFNMYGEEIEKTIAQVFDIHHEVIKIPNGNYIAAVSKKGYFFTDDEGIERESVEDLIVEVDAITGETVTEWDLAEVLDVDRVDLLDPNSGDWFHMNAIWYDESDTSLIISGRNQGVVKVDWENNLKWILAPHQGWGKAGRTGEGEETTPFLLTAVDENGTAYNGNVQLGTEYNSGFYWVWGQHTPMLLPNGNLFVFDNGFRRNFFNGPNFSAATEYKIDEENMTIEQVWAYGEERGEDAYSIIISDVDYLPQTGNIIFAPGNIRIGNGQSKIIEVAYPNKEVVFEATFKYKNQLGTGMGFGNIDIAYRAERVPLYR